MQKFPRRRKRVKKDMDSSELDLSTARQRLVEALNENCNQYFKCMKRWFRDEISKEEFDQSARTLFSESDVHLHNQFFLSILSRCQIRLTNRPPELSRQRMYLRNRAKRTVPDFDRALEPCIGLTANSVPTASAALPIGASEPSFSSTLGLLPDSGMTYGRAFVIAWEHSLQDVEQPAVSLIMAALDQMLKNLFQAVISMRRSHLTEEHNFAHMFGAKNVRRVTSTVSQHVVCASDTQISVQDFIDALKINKEVLPSHHLRTILLQRLMYLADR